MSLTKKILVVGANSNLENTIIRYLLNTKKYELVVVDRIIETILSSRSAVQEFDIFSSSEIEVNIKDIVQKYGKFDGFLYNITHSDFRPLAMVSHDNMVKIMNENFFSFIDFLRVLTKIKGLSEGSSIVALSSISSLKGMKAKMIFCSAKAALDASIRCLALELAHKSIRINSIQKGYVEEDFSKSHISAVSSIKNDEVHVPLGVTNGEEIAEAINFLLSDLSKTITGTSIKIDGGYSI